MFTISWTESEGRSRSHRFGSTIIDTIAKRSLGGHVAIYYARSGLMWQLTCPAGERADDQNRDWLSC
jgi:hypothetical protein